MQQGQPALTGVEGPNFIAMAFFAIFIGISLAITWFAARKTRSTRISTLPGDRSPRCKTAWRWPVTT